MNRAAVRHFVAVGVNDFAGIYRLLGIQRRDGFTGKVVIVADPGKRQQLIAIGYRHRADIQLWISTCATFMLFSSLNP